MKKLLLFLISALALGTSGHAGSIELQPAAVDGYVVITAAVPIRATAVWGAAVVGQAVPGDVFELSKEMPLDYAIILFAGDERFISKSAAHVVPFVKPILTEEVLRRAFSRFAPAEDRSFAEADARIAPEQVRHNIALQRLLEDRFKLEIMHQLKLPPALYNDILAEGVAKRWPAIPKTR